MMFPLWLRDISIHRKFIFIALLATVAATLFTILLMTVMQWFMLREELVKSVSAQVSVIASISAAELAANDREAAAKTVRALAVINNIEFAGILDRHGDDFALYVRPGLLIPPHQHQVTGREHHIHTATYIEVVFPVAVNREQIGMIHVRSGMAPVYKKLKWNIALIVGVAAGAFLIAMLLLLRLLPAITEPLRNLAALMGTVSRDNNFTLRAVLHGSDEIGTLAKEFNTMLAQIQMRDNELAQQRLHLQKEVGKRTADLKASNTQLGKELSERKSAEMELQDANEKLSILLDSLPTAVYRCRAQGDFAVMYMSQNVTSFTGYEPRDFIEDHNLWRTHIHPDDAPGVYDEIALLFEKGTHTYEYRWLKSDGSYLWIQDSLKLIYTEERTPMYMVGMWQDISAHKLAEEKIRRLNEELEQKVKERTQQLLSAQEELVRKEKLATLGQVIGSIGHELRNPLAIMSNAVYFLQTVLPDTDERVREYLGIIRNEIDDSERIVSDMLDSVRTKTPQPQEVVLTVLIKQTLSRLSIPSSVTVKLEIPATLSPLWADSLQIHQVLRNLISNAIEAMPDGGVLEISALENKPDATVILTVRDSGIGMTPKQLDELFQPLFTTKARGTGLGLMVVKNLTHANGGTVTVKSEVGRGTTFTLTLPASHSLIKDV
jgi:PAS domain S-box-containing protein